MEGRMTKRKLMKIKRLKQFLSANRHIINMSELDRICGFSRTTITSKLHLESRLFYPHQIKEIETQLKALRNTLNQYLNENN
jgi:hypothetical protein